MILAIQEEPLLGLTPETMWEKLSLFGACGLCVFVISLGLLIFIE